MARKKKKVVKHWDRPWQEKVVSALVVITLGLSAYFSLFDPWNGDFDPPQTLDTVIFRVGHGFKTMAFGVEGAIQDTNTSMQNTVDGRNDLNDGRIDRDTQSP